MDSFPVDEFNQRFKADLVDRVRAAERTGKLPRTRDGTEIVVLRNLGDWTTSMYAVQSWEL